MIISLLYWTPLALALMSLLGRVVQLAAFVSGRGELGFWFLVVTVSFATYFYGLYWALGLVFSDAAHRMLTAFLVPVTLTGLLSLSTFKWDALGMGFMSIKMPSSVVLSLPGLAVVRVVDGAMWQLKQALQAGPCTSTMAQLLQSESMTLEFTKIRTVTGLPNGNIFAVVGGSLDSIWDKSVVLGPAGHLIPEYDQPQCLTAPPFADDFETLALSDTILLGYEPQSGIGAPVVFLGIDGSIIKRTKLSEAKKVIRLWPDATADETFLALIYGTVFDSDLYTIERITIDEDMEVTREQILQLDVHQAFDFVPDHQGGFYVLYDSGAKSWRTYSLMNVSSDGIQFPVRLGYELREGRFLRDGRLVCPTQRIVVLPNGAQDERASQSLAKLATCYPQELSITDTGNAVLLAGRGDQQPACPTTRYSLTPSSSFLMKVSGNTFAPDPGFRVRPANVIK